MAEIEKDDSPYYCSVKGLIVNDKQVLLATTFETIVGVAIIALTLGLSAIVYIVLKNTDVPNWLNIILSIVLYYGVLQLFSAVWFWILLFIVLLSYITYRLIIYFKNKKAKNETKIQ